MRLVDEFVVTFGVWEEARPYVHLIVDEQEMELIVAMQRRPMSVGEVADLLGMDADQTADFLCRCYSRCVVNKTVEYGVTKYAPSEFSARLNHFAKFENWDDIPEEDRRLIDRRFLDQFIAKHRSNAERKTQGLSAESALPNDTVMLLSEVEEMIDAASDIVVQPCDCRRLGQRCNRPVDTCIWLDEGAREALDRGHGRRLTGEEAKALARWADRKGLMHTADREWHTHGLHAICNCCACDCYPFRAAQELGTKGIWPKSRHIAVYDQERCTLCGTCVRRCHFGAFYRDVTTVEVDGTNGEVVRYEPEKCWGCGLCVNTCPSDAIVMEALA